MAVMTVVLTTASRRVKNDCLLLKAFNATVQLAGATGAPKYESTIHGVVC
jgi:hypothetical protein